MYKVHPAKLFSGLAGPRCRVCGEPWEVPSCGGHFDFDSPGSGCELSSLVIALLLEQHCWTHSPTTTIATLIACTRETLLKALLFHDAVLHRAIEGVTCSVCPSAVEASSVDPHKFK